MTAKEIKVMSWNIAMLDLENDIGAIEKIIRNSNADIFILSEFPSNNKGKDLLEKLKNDYRYVLPTCTVKHTPRQPRFPSDQEQCISERYHFPPLTAKGYMITIVLIRKKDKLMNNFKIKDIKNNKVFGMNKEFRWVEIEGSFYGENITIIGVHIPICKKGGDNYWNFLRNHISNLNRKLIVIGDMNVSTLENDCFRMLEILKSEAELIDLACYEKNMCMTYTKGTRIDYVLLSETIISGKYKVEYLYNEGGKGFTLSDHLNIGVIIGKSK